MAQLWMDGFDHYGSDATDMLDGAWAEVKTTGADPVLLQAPAEGARTGDLSLRFQPGTPTNIVARRVLGAEIAEIFVSIGYLTDSLPTIPSMHIPMQFRDVNNVIIASVTVRPDGAIEFRALGEAGTILGVTTGPVIVASTWHHLEMRIVRHASAGIFELRVDEVVVISLTGLALGADNIAQIAVKAGTSGSDNTVFFVDDLIVRDATGTTNNTFMGDLRVATLQPVANGVNQGWSIRPIAKLGVGVMNFLDPADREMAIAYADNAAFEIGSGDFAIELFVRFNNSLTTTQTATLASKHRVSTDERSWRFVLNGPDVGGTLVFATSSDGTAGDEVNVHSFPFVPVDNRWYHIAVARSGTDSRLFLDGQQKGTTKTDSRTYDDNTASIFVNGHQDGASTALTGESMDGWIDGVRLTVGAARYTANFTPPSGVLPSDVSGDSLYNNVELLLNFDTVANVDESSNAFVGTLLNTPFVEFPDDAIAYQTIDGLTPNDNDFIEAALVAATGTLTVTANPLNTETVVMDAKTYKFVTALAAANDVLIGATAEDSLDNLIAAVNAAAGEGTLYGTGTTQNATISASAIQSDQTLATARTPGAAGNSLVTTETLSNGSWGAGTLAGGADIPANSEFTVSQLPADVTGVRSVAIVGRLSKTDSGTSKVQMSFVMSGGSSDQGADRAVTVNPTYYEDTFERDPATLGALTPSSILNARIRFNRTL